MIKKNMRPLDENEKTFAQKAIDGQQSELDHLRLMVEYNEFMLDKMLESNYLEKRRAFKRQNEEFGTEINEIQRTIDITAKQIAEGVEIKEDVAGTKELPSMVK